MSGCDRPHAHSAGRSHAAIQDSNSLRRSVPSERTFRLLNVNESIALLAICLFASRRSHASLIFFSTSLSSHFAFHHSSHLRRGLLQSAPLPPPRVRKPQVTLKSPPESTPLQTSPWSSSMDLNPAPSLLL